jgi:BMFP domain-containing protein YqiC
MSQKKFIEDIMTLGSGVVSNLVEARQELKAQAKERVGSVARGLDLVTREEFDAAFAMLAKARDVQEDVNERLARIEAHLNLSSQKKTVKTKKSSLPSVKTKAPRGKKK